MQVSSSVQELDRHAGRVAGRAVVESRGYWQSQVLLALYATLHGLLDHGDTHGTFESLVVQAAKLLDTPHGYLYLAEPGAETLVLQVATGVFLAARGDELLWASDLAQQAWQTSMVITTDNASEPDGDRLRLPAVVNVPIRSGSHFFGVLGLAYVDGARVFGTDEITLLQGFSDIVGLALDQASRAHVASQKLAAHQQAEQQFRQAADELRHAMNLAEATTQAKSISLDYMSHEIRTLLTNMLGMTDLLRRSSLSSDQREGLEILRISSDALLTIVDDMLDLSKIESGHVVLAETHFDLQSCIEDAISLTAVLAAQKQLEVTYDIDRHVPRYIQADAAHLQQILVNLLTNAIKATHMSDIYITVDATQRSVSTCELHFAVYDTGIGIPPERIGDLFKPFSQINLEAHSYHGTGLGLMISKQLSELMGGRIWVDSTVGVGSAFHFTIMATGAPSAHPEQQHAALADRRLLLVSDHSRSRQALMRQAQTWGMLIVDTAMPHEALAWIRQGQLFDIAIIDLRSTSTDRRALIDELRRYCSAQTLPVFLVIPFATHEDWSVLDRQIQAVFHKPLRLLQIERALLELFEDQLHTATPAGTLPVAPQLAAGERLRILMADDDTTNRVLNQQYIQQLGHHVVAVQSGQQALAALEHDFYEIVLLDIQMEDMSGVEVARRIREYWHGQQRPYLIALTGNAQPGAQTGYIAAGFDDYLRKPVRAMQLSHALTRFRAARVAMPDDAPAELAVAAATDMSTAAAQQHIPPLLFKIYLDDAATLIDTISNAIIHDDRVAIRRAAHKLKSSSALVIAERLARLCDLLENAPDAAASTWVAQFDAIVAEFARVEQAILQRHPT